MRPLRWKNRYLSGNNPIDQRNKKFVSCLNQLMESVNQREHCQEMEQFITDLSTDAEAYLLNADAATHDAIAEFYPRLIAALPLSSNSTMACRKCELCDVAKAKIAAHLREPLDCLQIESTSGVTTAPMR